MNLYVQRRPNGMWAHLINAEGMIVGSLKPDVADYLITSGKAMDITERPTGG